MAHALLPFLAFTLLPLAAARAQWVDGELIVDTTLASGDAALVRIDPTTGTSLVLLSPYSRIGWAGAVVFDSYRGGLVANLALPPDPYWLGKLWVIQSNGTTTAIPGLTNVHVRGLCTAGDGRIFFQDYAAPGQIRWLDANNTVHTLLDASGSAPFSFTIEHLMWHAPTNSLLATNSGWWSTNHCAPSSCSIHRLPLSLDGTRVVATPLCASFATGSHEVMSIDYLPGGDVLLCLANGVFSTYPMLLRVDPTSLTITSFAQPQPGDLNGGYYHAGTGRVVVLDDAANVLRTYAPGSSGMGGVLSTTLPVSGVTSGYSPAESMWKVDVNGPACQGSAVGYGVGLAGAGGFVPTLGVVNCPDLGQPFTIALDRAVGGAIGLLGLGAGPANVPALGGTLWIFPITATVVVVAGGSAGLPGAGNAGLPLLVNDPALVGVPLWFQGAFYDAAAVAEWSLTNGLQLVIG